MIVRTQPDGSTMLMTQTDHSRLAGFLASHWGNATYAPLQPWESVARAATFHDFGWLRYETRPELNPDSLEPFTFLNLPFDPTQLDNYQWVVDWLSAVDPYSALLVGMHRIGLWKSRYDTIAYPAWRNANVQWPQEIQEFIATQEPIQAEQRDQIGGETIWTNYRLLQVWDLLGLYFTMGEPYDHAVEPVPTTYDGDLHSGVRMAMHPLGNNRVQFDPYPFDCRPLTVHIPYRRLPGGTFESGDAFRKAFYQATPELLTYALE